jgi:hypothetical protein
MWQNLSVTFRPGDIMINSALIVVVAAVAGMADMVVSAPALANGNKHFRHTAPLPVVMVAGP